MDYKIYSKDTAPVIVLRLDPGEEIVESILALAEKEEIQAGTIEGIGATDDVTIGIMDLNSREYKMTHYTEPFEITSIMGNLSRKDGKAYLHSHINLGGVGGSVIGGHLDSGVISITAEIFIRVIDGAIDRKYHDEIGVNQMIF